jgi:hypothetical protein
MTVLEKIQLLGRYLYPTGRAFKMPIGGFFDKLNNGLAASEERFYNDAVSILNSLLPDNANFTTEDASNWERRLGLIDGSANSLSDRKLAIKRKMSAPGLNPAKGHYQYIQSQLQAAGFNVYVYENIPDNTPTFYGYASTVNPFRHGQANHGMLPHGGALSNKIVNYIDEEKDLSFNLGGTYKLTFFIGGSTIGTSANVLLTRKKEFRQLILKLKQVQTVGLLYINYI